MAGEFPVHSTGFICDSRRVNRKVACVLEELGLTYESKFLDFGKEEQKAEIHTKYNPNGRIPTLIDHRNNDFAIWLVDRVYHFTFRVQFFQYDYRESGAILTYLVEKYDPEHIFYAETAVGSEDWVAKSDGRLCRARLKKN